MRRQSAQRRLHFDLRSICNLRPPRRAPCSGSALTAGPLLHQHYHCPSVICTRARLRTAWCTLL
eukprot:6089665-Alexandrium_andersonii.AAC.1